MAIHHCKSLSFIHILFIIYIESYMDFCLIFLMLDISSVREHCSFHWYQSYVSDPAHGHTSYQNFCISAFGNSKFLEFL
jgi:hypothetical protein